VRKALHVRQDCSGPKVGIQIIESFHYPVCQFPSLEELFRRRARLPRRKCCLERAIIQVRRELFGSPARSSDTIQIRSYQDSEEPRTASVLVSKLAEMLERA